MAILFNFSWIFEKLSVVLQNKTNTNMTFTKEANQIFERAINDYHVFDDVDTPLKNPYQKDSIQYSLYKKCWIDTVQWHYEDIIRDPHIDPVEALALKRRIDRSNQDRTDLVEEIDSWFRQHYSQVVPQAVYHMQEQVNRTDAEPEHIAKCKAKLDVLLEQQVDLSLAIDQLLEDIEAGRKYMKVYRQMKMYNDPATNPILYNQK